MLPIILLTLVLSIGPIETFHLVEEKRSLLIKKFESH